MKFSVLHSKTLGGHQNYSIPIYKSTFYMTDRIKPVVGIIYSDRAVVSLESKHLAEYIGGHMANTGIAFICSCGTF